MDAIDAYVSDWAESKKTKFEELRPPMCDKDLILFVKSTAALKLCVVISTENKVDITYTVFHTVSQQKKEITFFGDAKEYYDSL